MTRVARQVLRAGVLTVFASLAGAQGVTDREILVGQFAAVTGPSAQLGQRLQAGIQAYFASVNAQVIAPRKGQTIRTHRKMPTTLANASAMRPKRRLRSDGGSAFICSPHNQIQQ